MSKLLFAYGLKKGDFTIKGLKNFVTANFFSMSDVIIIIALAIYHDQLAIDLQSSVDDGSLTEAEKLEVEAMLLDTEQLDAYITENDPI